MSLRSVLYEHLSNDPGLAPLTDNRVFNRRAPQGVVVPFLVWRRVTVERFPAMGGSARVVNSRIQIEAFAGDEDSVEELAQALVDSLDGWIDPASDPEVFGTSTADDQEDSYDDVTGLYYVTIDTTVSHRE